MFETETRIHSFEVYIPMISTSFLRDPYASQFVVWKRTQIKYWNVIVAIDFVVMDNVIVALSLTSFLYT